MVTKIQRRIYAIEDFIDYSAWASDGRRTKESRREYRDDASRVKRQFKLTSKEIDDGYKRKAKVKKR